MESNKNDSKAKYPSLDFIIKNNTSRLYKTGLFLSVIAFFIILIYLCLLYSHGFIKCDALIDIEQFGQVGDFIGGVSGTIISVATLFFIIITFNTQKEELEKTRIFLKEQSDSMELDQKISSIENLIKEVLYYIKEIEWDGLKGIYAIRKYQISKTGITTSFLDEYNAILVSFEILIKTANTIKNSEVKTNYLNRIYTLFYSKILWNTKSNIFDNQKQDIFDKNDDAQLIIPKYIHLSLETIKYMIDNGLSKSSDYKDQNIKDLKIFLEAIKN